MNETNWKSPSLLSILLILIILGGVVNNIKPWRANKVIDWDVIIYYDYIPATFIFHDINMKFYDANPEALFNGRKFWPRVLPNGNKVFKSSMGMSFLYFPFFLIAHIQTQWENGVADGFSLQYHRWIALSCLFYLGIGLLFLRRVLLKYFKDSTTSIVLWILTMGTNLFYYCTTEPAMPHAYNFCLIAIFLYLFIRFYEQPNIKYAFLSGLLLGLIILIRPSNIVVALIIPFFYLKHIKELPSNLKKYIGLWPYFLIMMMGVILIWVPQLAYWKKMTGQYWYYSYDDEYFFFLKPHILEGLFGFRKGWLIYTPLMVLSLTGFYYLNKTKKEWVLPLSIFTTVNLYIIFSWWCWWYAGGFSIRPMVDSYSLLSIPLAASIEHIFNLSRVRKTTYGIIIFLFVCLNLFQTLQYRKAIIHYDSMNFKAYLEAFGRSEYPPGLNEKLTPVDYEKAKRGE